MQSLFGVHHSQVHKKCSLYHHSGLQFSSVTYCINLVILCVVVLSSFSTVECCIALLCIFAEKIWFVMML